MLLHITHDDKFIDHFINIAIKCTNKEQKFVIYTSNPEYKLKHVKNHFVQPTHLYTKNFWQILGDLSQYSTIYIHYLSLELLDFLNSVPHNVKIVWIFWGADAFDLPGLRENTYLDITRTVVKESNNISIWGKAKKLYSDRRLLKKYEQAVARIDYFAHYIPEDYLKVKTFLKARFKYIDFTYGTVEQFVIPDSMTTDAPPSGKVNILIGNSANPANNHLDAIDFLSKVELPCSKIYMPLSYSGTPAYIEIVTSTGDYSFGENFVPLVNFMPVEAYYTILNTVGYAIMPHIRSQAWGNIIALLWLGVKVFMSDKSSLYHLLIRYGFHIYSLASLKEETFSLPLSPMQVKDNQGILKKHFSEDATLARYNNLLHL